jgi:hypothetical protein
MEEAAQPGRLGFPLAGSATSEPEAANRSGLASSRLVPVAEAPAR